MGVEFRDERMESLAGAEVELRRTAEEVAHAEQVAITVTAQRNTPSVPISGNMQQLIADAAGMAGLEHVSLPSGAAHDAQAIAAINAGGDGIRPQRRRDQPRPGRSTAHRRTAPTGPRCC